MLDDHTTLFRHVREEKDRTRLDQDLKEGHEYFTGSTLHESNASAINILAALQAVLDIAAHLKWPLSLSDMVGCVSAYRHKYSGYHVHSRLERHASVVPPMRQSIAGTWVQCFHRYSATSRVSGRWHII